ncbi:hypothetical protein Rumeso_01261 [Rubellimicrobium mesophilum DSM 19309]|uniref:Uncharacterized protein n=1 Tax=Rubellimicrobium mesophilum DSM 19309 TaxID=442562 RepID=A0A017HTT2_9RHOB|nr:hypothetical protein Rumeso_01261 [Rubellimicrobium mesophilum DSM 19309]
MADGTAADPRTVYLKDYAPFPWVVDGVDLTFALAPGGPA